MRSRREELLALSVRNEARIDAHDTRFEVINGNIKQFAVESAGLATAVRELSADIKASHETAAALRLADKDRAGEIDRRRKQLAEEDDDRRARAEQARQDLLKADEDREERKTIRFAPITRWLAVLSGVEGLVGLLFYLDHVFSATPLIK